MRQLNSQDLTISHQTARFAILALTSLLSKQQPTLAFPWTSVPVKEVWSKLCLHQERCLRESIYDISTDLCYYGPSRRLVFNVFQDISRSWLPAPGRSPSLSLSLVDSVPKYSSRCNIDTGSLKASSFLGIEWTWMNLIFANPSDFRLSLLLCVPTESTGSTVPQKFLAVCV